jgi:hypothetical protein
VAAGAAGAAGAWVAAGAQDARIRPAAVKEVAFRKSRLLKRLVFIILLLNLQPIDDLTISRHISEGLNKIFLLWDFSSFFTAGY